MVEGSRSEQSPEEEKSSEKEKRLSEVPIYDIEKEFFRNESSVLKGIIGDPDKIKNDFDEAFNKHKGKLSRVGLGVELVQKGENNFTVQFSLDNGSKFIEYINDILDDDTGDSTVFAKKVLGLRDVLKRVIDDLEKEYDLTDPNDEKMINLTSNFFKITEKYRQCLEKGNMSLEDKLLNQMEFYSEMIKDKKLKEFIDKKRLGYK